MIMKETGRQGKQELVHLFQGVDQQVVILCAVLKSKDLPEADSYVSVSVGQFFEVTQYGVHTAGTNKRMEELMSHEVSRDILNT